MRDIPCVLLRLVCPDIFPQEIGRSRIRWEEDPDIHIASNSGISAMISMRASVVVPKALDEIHNTDID